MKSGMKKAMKAGMKKKKAAKRVSTIGKGRMAKFLVLSGKKKKTVGGLKASDLTKNKSGKVVSKKLRAKGLSNKWAKACKAARVALKIKGFCPFGGKQIRKSCLQKTSC